MPYSSLNCYDASPDDVGARHILSRIMWPPDSDVKYVQRSCGSAFHGLVETCCLSPLPKLSIQAIDAAMVAAISTTVLTPIIIITMRESISLSCSLPISCVLCRLGLLNLYTRFPMIYIDQASWIKRMNCWFAC